MNPEYPAYRTWLKKKNSPKKVGNLDEKESLVDKTEFASNSASYEQIEKKIQKLTALMTDTNNKVNSILIKVDSIEGKATTENNEERKPLPPIQSDSYTPVEGKASTICIR
jgi:tRNA U34 5-carboxymethylaminomethyl modifying enzyme MnmG/GidA